MNTPAIAFTDWITALNQKLDALENALLATEAPAVERASADVQCTLQELLERVEISAENVQVRQGLREAAKRFGHLRQAVVKAGANNQRALGVLLPEQQPATYQRQSGFASGRGAGQAYLRA